MNVDDNFEEMPDFEIKYDGKTVEEEMEYLLYMEEFKDFEPCEKEIQENAIDVDVSHTYDNHDWSMSPFFFVPLVLVWGVLDDIAKHLRIAPKLSLRYDWDERTVSKWLHRINHVLAYIVLFAIIAMFAIVGIDVSKWIADR